MDLLLFLMLGCAAGGILIGIPIGYIIKQKEEEAPKRTDRTDVR